MASRDYGTGRIYTLPGAVNGFLNCIEIIGTTGKIRSNEPFILSL